MTIYLDIIFIENILMNYIILFATIIILKTNTKHTHIRILISSILGSIYSVIVYLNILTIYSNIIAKIILSIVMVYVAFVPRSIKQLLKQLLIFYFVSFIFGGCTFALIYLIKPENAKISNGVFVGIYPIKVTIIAGVIAFVITQIVFRINKIKLNSKNTFANIEIKSGENKLVLKALIDSGNMLQDPISKIPVIIVEKEKLEDLIPTHILNYLETVFKGGESLDKKDIKSENKNDMNQYLSKVRMVPFMSIGKENGMLVGIRMDNIKIKTEELNVEGKKAIIGIYNKKLTKDNKYNALIGLNLLEGENDNELITSIKK